MLLMTGGVFANTPILENEIALLKEKQAVTAVEVSKEDAVCVQQCSRVIGGVTYTAEAGNFLSTCEGALRRCEAKLDKLNTLN